MLVPCQLHHVMLCGSNVWKYVWCSMAWSIWTTICLMLHINTYKQPRSKFWWKENLFEGVFSLNEVLLGTCVWHAKHSAPKYMPTNWTSSKHWQTSVQFCTVLFSAAHYSSVPIERVRFRVVGMDLDQKW